MAIKVKRFAALSLTLMFLLVCICGIAGTRVLGEEQPTQLEQIEKMKRNGYGWTNAPLVIQKTDPRTKVLVETYPGLVMLKQTQTKFRVQIEMLEGWTIMETRIYIGLEDPPTAAGKKPITALFPYREIFNEPVSSPVSSYELLLDPVEDLGIESFQRHRGENLNIVVYVHARGPGEKGRVVLEKAWARGEMENPTPSYPDPKNPNTYPFIEGTTDVCYILYEIMDENENDMFRKNVSKEPECETSKAKIEIMHYYVQARAANGDPVELGYRFIEDFTGELDDEGNPVYIETEEQVRNVVKPLVSVYAQEVPGNNYPDIYTGELTNCASDVFASVSLDEGNSWKVTNLSRAADRSSFTLGDASLYPGFEFPGEVKKPNVKQQGNTVMVAWTSKYARSGSPTYARSEYLPELDADGNKVIDLEGNVVYTDVPDPYYEDDIWGVGGAQRSKDYTNVEAGFPGIEIPYSVVWICRGFIEEDGTIIWMKPERLTSGRRDAEQVAVASSPAGYAVIWQEDPDGLRPGDGAGPGHGWSGATTNHKTDIWYSYITMEDFYEIDEDFISGGEGYTGNEPDKGKGRPKALVPMKLPVRISDNDTLNLKNMKISASEDNLQPYTGTDYPYADKDKLFKLYKSEIIYDSEFENETETAAIGIYSCDDGGCGSSEGEGGQGKGDFLGSHRYGLADDSPLWRDDGDNKGPYILFYEKMSNSPVHPEIRYVAITADDVLLDGNTGGSRPNIMLQNYTNSTGVTSAWAVIGYEESKGTGSGPPDREDGEDGGCGCGDDEGDKEPGTGAGSDRYYPDRGKNVIYHSFDFQKPHTVSAGDVLNPQEVVENEEGELELSWLVDAEGEPKLDWKGDPMPNYENARRPRFIIQSMKNAKDSISGVGDDTTGTVMVSVFKMGREGKGRPSDIIMVRWEISKTYNGNPYLFSNLAMRDADYAEDKIVDWQNLSSVTPLAGGYVVEYTQKGEAYNRIYEWEQTEDNLYDFTWTEPGLDARAHRGFLKGDFLAIAMNFTPNWRQARNGHDIYNCYIRRSFDGGKTWTTDPEGEGVTQQEILKEITGTDDEGKTTFVRYVDEQTYGPGEFQPMRNVSLLKNNKVITIEPRLVGAPGTTWTDLSKLDDEIEDENGLTQRERFLNILGDKFVPYKVDPNNSDIWMLYRQDQQDAEAFWMTYGTETVINKDGSGGDAADIFYSFSTDRGETFGNTSEDYLKEDKETELNPFESWDWLAKDRRGIEMEQAECQIRYLPDGSVFYAVWNEASDEGSDAIFRRILRKALVGDISSIVRIYEKPVKE